MAGKIYSQVGRRWSEKKSMSDGQKKKYVRWSEIKKCMSDGQKQKKCVCLQNFQTNMVFPSFFVTRKDTAKPNKAIQATGPISLSFATHIAVVPQVRQARGAHFLRLQAAGEHAQFERRDATRELCCCPAHGEKNRDVKTCERK